ncbi:enhancer of mRNA-decapping protein 4-like [Achroia grisella]|uniref:enhancer of mRNA-decapping protein 4-like n=1 Tax=Achroia grisella TaxID=688607 RepID=UPI0027D27CF7|nr:enhancer of mRNA-decapping protein 4-like [Achroia grisella]
MDRKSNQNDEQFTERSKSMCSLQNEGVKEITFPSCRGYSRRISDSSVEIYIVNDFESDVSLGDAKRMQDSGLGDKLPLNSERYTVLEQKIDKLNDLFLEQCSLLHAIQGEIRESMSAIENSGQLNNQYSIDLISKFFNQSKLMEQSSIKQAEVNCSEEKTNSRAKSLLDAIEFKQAYSLDSEIKDAMTKFLQSDDLKKSMLAATASSVKSVIEKCITQDMSTLYLPVLERSHRRLVKHVTKAVEGAFTEIEENSGSFTRHAHKTWRALRNALDQHRHLLENHTNRGNLLHTLQYTVEELLKNELMEWRQKVLEVLSINAPDCILEELEPCTPPLECAPVSSPQPAGTELSIIDQMMQTAEINKLIEDGDVNSSFEKALSASDLGLVMTACRAADPATVFAAPCKLEQSVLLSLIQQLATDMVHDTQLKCRYLEDAIIHLNTADPATRTHLPLVVGEVRKHLKMFLKSYPSHVAGRRVTLIVMASDNLLK